MEIQEEENINSTSKAESSSKNNKPLSLRKQKPPKQNQQNNTQVSLNSILNGEIVLQNEQIEFIHKKRHRLTNNVEIIKQDQNKKYKDYEEEQLTQKIIEIYNKLQVKCSSEIKEGEYNTEYHDKREAIVNELLKNTELFNDIRKFATKTTNADIYCTILDMFNDFCYYNNEFMINSHDYLKAILNNAFEFDDKYKYKTISLSIKFCYSVIDFGFFDENNRQEFINYFIELILNEQKNKYISSVQGAKTYLYFIIYLTFKDSWEYININPDIFQKFIKSVLSEININNCELLEVIILLINTCCDNILYPKIFQKKDINYDIAIEINKYMFELVSVILTNLPPNEKDKIIKVDNINYIIKQTFNVIIKIISGINLIQENDEKNENNKNDKNDIIMKDINDQSNVNDMKDINENNNDNDKNNLNDKNDNDIQKKLVPEKGKQILYEFIMLFSGFNLDEKNFLWLADIMAKFAEIPYYSDIYIKEEIKDLIFNKFMLKEKYICDIFQFLRSLLEVKPLFEEFSLNDKFYEALNRLDIDKHPFHTVVHFLFMIENLLVDGEKYKKLNDIYVKLCNINAKERVEKIYYKYGNDEIVNKKYNEIMPKLEKLKNNMEEDKLLK